MPLPDGGVAEVKLDFEVLRRLGDVARSHGLAGAVQHGASTLPDELFHRFPAVETAEIHLATGFQNALFEHPAFPKELHEQIERWCFENAPDERKPDQTDEQFVYTTRKKAIGPFKRELWDLSTKDEILAAQRRKITFLFTELGRERVAGDGRAVHPAGRAAAPGAGGPPRGDGRGRAAERPASAARGPADPPRDAGGLRGDRPPPARGLRAIRRSRR